MSLAVGDTGVRHTGSFRVFPAIWASLLPLSESSTVSNCFDDMLALFPLKETIFCQCRGHNWCGSGPNQDCLSAGITRQAMLRTLDPEMVEEFDYKECVSASSLTPMCRLCKIVMPHQADHGCTEISRSHPHQTPYPEILCNGLIFMLSITAKLSCVYELCTCGGYSMAGQSPHAIEPELEWNPTGGATSHLI